MLSSLLALSLVCFMCIFCLYSEYSERGEKIKTIMSTRFGQKKIISFQFCNFCWRLLNKLITCSKDGKTITKSLFILNKKNEFLMIVKELVEFYRNFNYWITFYFNEYKPYSNPIGQKNRSIVNTNTQKYRKLVFQAPFCFNIKWYKKPLCNSEDFFEFYIFSVHSLWWIHCLRSIKNRVYNYCNILYSLTSVIGKLQIIKIINIHIFCVIFFCILLL